MMANDLVLLDTINKVSNVCSNVTSFITAYKKTRIADRARMQSIIDEIELAHTMQRSKAIGLIGNSNLMQIKDYMKVMEGMPQTGPLYDAAVKNLEVMNNALCKNLEEFTK